MQPKSQAINQFTRSKVLILFKFFVNFGILALCVYHLYTYSQKYFAYSVVYKSGPFVPVYTQMPRLSLCFTYFPLLNSKIDKEFFDTIDQTDPKTNEILNMTVDELFKVTPNSEEMLTSCSYRFTDRSGLTETTNVTECVDRFNIRKYFTQGYVCYMFEPEDFGVGQDLALVTTHMHGRRVLYEISIASPLNQGLKLLPLVHYYEEAYFDMIYNMDLLPSIEKHERFVLTYDVYQTYSLPSPYTDNCVQYFQQSKCEVDCMNDILARENLIYGPSFIFDPQNAIFLVTDANSTRETQRESENCAKKCKKISCEDYFAVTYFSQPFASSSKLTVALEAVMGPIYRTKSIPAIEQSEYVLQLATIVSVYLGVSILGTSQTLQALKDFVCVPSFKKQVVLYYHRLMKSYLEFRRVKRSHCKLKKAVWSINGDPETLNVTNRSKAAVKLKKLLPVVSGIFRIAVIISLATEIILITTEYMEYGVKIFYKLNVNETRIDIPSLAICAPSSVLFNIPEVFHNISGFDKSGRMEDRMTNYTLRNLLDSVPDPSSVIMGCRIRKHSYYQLIYHDNIDYCFKKLNMTKFYMNRQLCYKISLVHSTSDRKIELYRETIFTPGVIFTVSFRPLFTRFFRLETMLFHESYPFYSREYSYIIILERNVYQMYLISYTTSTHESLKKPYTSNCYEPLDSKVTCMGGCITKQMERINRLPYSEVLTDPIDKYILSYTDLTDEKVAQQVSQINNRCSKMCSALPCTMSFTKTTVSYAVRSEFPLELSVHIPMHPEVNSETEPRVSFLDTLFRCGCCVSFWLGLSLLLMNPLVIWLKFKLLPFTVAFQRRMRKMERLVHFIHTWSQMALAKFGRRVRKSFKEPTVELTKSPLARINLGIILKLASLLCSSAHLVFITMKYMEYPTEMNTVPSHEDNFSPKRLTVCSRADELIYGKRDSKNALYNLTVAQIFSLTPEINDIIEGCGYRSLNQSFTSIKLPQYLLDRIFIFDFGPTNCTNRFNFEKSVTQNFVCYSSWPKVYPVVNQRHEFLFSPKLMFYTSYYNSIATTRMMVTVSEDSPYASKMFSPTIYGGTRQALHFVSYIKYTQNILPYPYDSDFYTSPAFSICIKNCLLKRIDREDKTVHDEFYTKAINKKYIQYTSNESDWYTSIRDKCSFDCSWDRQNENEYNTFVTTVSQIRFWQIPSLSYLTYSTSMPVLTSEFRKKYSLYDLCLKIGSIIAIWFGLSVLDLDPFSFLQEKLSCVRQESDVEKRIVALEQQMHEVERAHKCLNSVIMRRNGTGFP